MTPLEELELLRREWHAAERRYAELMARVGLLFLVLMLWAIALTIMETMP